MIQVVYVIDVLIYFPCNILQIPAVLNIAKDFKKKEDAELVKLIEGDSYMHAAVIECYKTIKCLIYGLLVDEAVKK